MRSTILVRTTTQSKELKASLKYSFTPSANSFIIISSMKIAVNTTFTVSNTPTVLSSYGYLSRARIIVLQMIAIKIITLKILLLDMIRALLKQKNLLALFCNFSSF